MRRIYNSWLFAGFGAVIIAFLASTFFQSSFFDVRRHTLSLLQNALPSVEHLSNARTELYAVEEAVLARSTGHELDDRLSLLESELRAYDTSPDYAGEQDAYQRARERVTDFEVAARVAAGRGKDTVEEVRLLSARADDALLALIQLNVANARRVSANIDSQSRRAVVVGVVFDSAAAIVALVTMLLFRHLVKKYLVLSEAHQHGLERRAEELENFAGRVAHDLRGPLSAVIMGLGAAARIGPTDPTRFRTLMSKIRAGVDRCESLIEALLSFASAGASFTPGEQAEVMPVLRGVLEDIATPDEEGLEMEVEGAAPGFVACSRGVLTSLLSNVIQNAVKYTRGRPIRKVTVRLSRSQEHVRIEVTDTGPGIPNALKRRIFEPFVRAPGVAQPGLGLGLATVKKLVEAHGGRVGVDNAPEQGSLFWFELPSAAAAEESVSLPH